MNDLISIFQQELAPDLYYFSQEMSFQELTNLAQDYHFNLYYLEGEGINTKADFLTDCAKKMNFAEYFGHNWDAFEDGLTDLLLAKKNPTLIIYDHPENFATDQPQEWDNLINIWQSVIEFLQEHNISLWIVIQENSLSN